MHLFTDLVRRRTHKKACLITGQSSIDWMGAAEANTSRDALVAAGALIALNAAGALIALIPAGALIAPCALPTHRD
eukprot:365315-Chlamydomonas_euryale.AAC.8